MDDYICDDRIDVEQLLKEINSMSDQEFEEYIKNMKEHE